MGWGDDVQDEGEEWVVAEERGDGTQWPLLLVTTEREAIDIVRALRGRGLNVFAVLSDPSDDDQIPLR
jgi:hypothetical protein